MCRPHKTISLTQPEEEAVLTFFPPLPYLLQVGDLALFGATAHSFVIGHRSLLSAPLAGKTATSSHAVTLHPHFKVWKSAEAF